MTMTYLYPYIFIFLSIGVDLQWCGGLLCGWGYFLFSHVQYCGVEGAGANARLHYNCFCLAHMLHILAVGIHSHFL